MDPHFPWPVLRSVLGGTSALDLPRLVVADRAEAEAFVAGYGFAWDVPAQRAELDGIRAESWAFLEEELLDPGESVPAAVRALDVPDLLLAASGQGGESQRWACAVLRVGHTVAHSSSHFEDRYGSAIRERILGGFDGHLHATDDGLVLGDELPLDLFEVKGRKSRRSVILKLLHKRENVAAAVFDRIGVRLVAPTAFDALLCVRYLRTHNLIVLPNVWPDKSRNTLIDLDEVEAEVARTDALVAAGELDREAQLATLRARAWTRPAPREGPAGRNVFSSGAFQSIQVTCRQLVRVHDPEAPGGEIRFFFPYEVQVLDREGYTAVLDGRASHEDYKARQRRAVRRRVLGIP